MEQLRGKIYRLDAPDGTYYIGSTTLSLQKRLWCHKADAKKNRSKLYNHINQLGWDAVKISLIEEINCNTIQELRLRENQEIEKYILDPLCLNSIKCIHNQKEYYQNHKNQILCEKKDYRLNNIVKYQERDKKYYESNKDKILQQKREYYQRKKLNSFVDT